MRWTREREKSHIQGLLGHLIPWSTDVFSGRRMKIFIFPLSSTLIISRSTAVLAHPSYHIQERANPLFVLSLFLFLFLCLSQSPGLNSRKWPAFGPWRSILDRSVETALISCGEALLQFLATRCKSLFYPSDRTRVERPSE